jgi:hypothetical protein
MVRRKLATKSQRRAFWKGKIKVVASRTGATTTFEAVWRTHVKDRAKGPIGYLVVDTRTHVVRFARIYRYKGLGIGEHLYLYALAHFGELKTDYNAHSEDARRVWDKLVRKLDNSRHRGFLTVRSPALTVSRRVTETAA